MVWFVAPCKLWVLLQMWATFIFQVSAFVFRSRNEMKLHLRKQHLVYDRKLQCIDITCWRAQSQQRCSVVSIRLMLSRRKLWLLWFLFCYLLWCELGVFMCVRKHVTLSTSCLMGNLCSDDFNDFSSLGLCAICNFESIFCYRNLIIFHVLYGRHRGRCRLWNIKGLNGKALHFKSLMNLERSHAHETPVFQ